MSDQAATRSVVQLLVDVMRNVRAVAKDGLHQTQHARFNFRGIDAVMNAVGPALRDVGIVVIPRMLRCDHTTVAVGRNNTQMGHVKVEVEYTFYGPAGDTLVGSAVGEAMDSGDKAAAKAMSVAFRTFLLQSLCLPTDDIDPDEEAYERAPRADVPQQPARQPERPANGQRPANVTQRPGNAQQRPASPAQRPAATGPEQAFTHAETLSEAVRLAMESHDPAVLRRVVKGLGPNRAKAVANQAIPPAVGEAAVRAGLLPDDGRPVTLAQFIEAAALHLEQQGGMSLADAARAEAALS